MQALRILNITKGHLLPPIPTCVPAVRCQKFKRGSVCGACGCRGGSAGINYRSVSFLFRIRRRGGARTAVSPYIQDAGAGEGEDCIAWGTDLDGQITCDLPLARRLGNFLWNISCGSGDLKGAVKNSALRKCVPFFSILYAVKNCVAIPSNFCIL